MYDSSFKSKLVKIIHYIVTFTLIFGIFLPNKYLIYYIFLWPAVYAHWFFNDNKCMLTELELHFNQKFININIDEEVNHHKHIENLEGLKKFNIYFDNIDSFTSYFYNIVVVCWVIGFIRLVVYYRKNILNFLSIIIPPLSKRVIYDKYKS